MSAAAITIICWLGGLVLGFMLTLMWLALGELKRIRHALECSKR